jgi:hypothetical protein
VTTPGISVVLATYNGAAHLEEQLTSLAAQTLPPLELVVSDDGSTDDTIAIVERFAASAAFPVRIARNAQRLGYGGNFLSAASRAEGDLIAFCDQDDVWYPRKLEVARRELDRSGAALFVHVADVIDAGSAVIGGFDQHIRGTAVRPAGSLPPWGVYYGFTMVFRREVLEVLDETRRGRHPFEHEAVLSHDLWVYFVASSLFSVVEFDEPLAGYRQHGSNQTPHLRGAPLRRLTASLGQSVHEAVRRDRIAAERAELLSGLAASPDPALAAAARAAAQYWRELARREHLRVAVYGARTPLARGRALGSAARAGTYASVATGGLGSRLALKDLLAGVVGARRSKRFLVF